MTTETEAPEVEAPIETVEPVAETPAVETVDVEAEAKAKATGVEKRIAELTRARREAERRADAAERQLAEKAQADVEPTEDQFESNSDFIKALAKHEAKQAVAATVQETTAKTAERARLDAWESRQTIARESLPDYDTVIAANADLPVSPHVGRALMESDHGPALQYHMAKNPDVLARLNAMSDYRAAIEIGRLETTLDAKPVKSPSKAPAPATPIDAARNPIVDLKSASMEDYIAARNKQGAGYRL